MNPLERLLAEADITRVVTRYALLNDDCDFDAVAALFTQDGVLRRPSGGEPIRGRAAILEAFRARPPRTSRHVISNVLVDLQSAGEAICRSTMLLYSAPPGELPAKALHPALLGGFEDRLVQQGAAWLFAERRGWLDLRLEP
jgi:ketosteroid isomerase-like protein